MMSLTNNVMREGEGEEGSHVNFFGSPLADSWDWQSVPPTSMHADQNGKTREERERKVEIELRGKKNLAAEEMFRGVWALRYDLGVLGNGASRFLN